MRTFIRLVLLLSLIPLVGVAEVSKVTIGRDAAADVTVTVYNNGYGFVRERRHVTLPVGEFEIMFEDVAAAIEAASVSVNGSDGFTLLEQNYRFDLFGVDTLLQRFVGRPVEVVGGAADGGRPEQVRRGRLLGRGGGLVVAFDEGIEINPRGTLRLPEVPDDLLIRPTLLWRVDNNDAEQQVLAVAYLTREMSWEANYVAVLDAADSRLDLTARVSLTNRSGTDYPRARLRLVAGDVRREAPGLMWQRRSSPEASVAYREVPDAFAEERFFDYRLYTLARRSTLNHDETKQLRLFAGDGIPVRRSYHLEGKVLPGDGQPVQERHPEVRLAFDNNGRSGLGMPLPAGRVRVYRADGDGGLQFVGEDRIGHTPQDETVVLAAGSAFDIVATRTRTGFRRLSERHFEVVQQQEIRNRKDVPMRVLVEEHIVGDWVVTDATLDDRRVEFARADAHRATVSVDVAAGTSAMLRYTVRMKPGM